MANYGIPYMGSKDGIADKVIKIFPKAEHFYDIFGGGFSITHAMLTKRPRDYKHFHFNEIKKDIVALIKDAISGKFNYKVFKPKFISRKEFFDNLNDAYIRSIWSFGSNQKTYLFSKEIEPYKKSMHNAIVFNEFDDLAQKVFGHSSFQAGYSITQRRLFLRARIDFYRKTGIPGFLHQYLSEQQLQRLQQLQQLERLNFYNESYEKIKIKPNSIIYCDPPYACTADYGGSFDTKKFLDWCDAQSEPVFISEYNISDKRFRLVKEFKKRSMLSSQKYKAKKMTERVYVNKVGVNKYLEGKKVV